MVPHRSSFLLAHIVSRLSNRTEDIAVDALAYILSHSLAARATLRRLLHMGGLEDLCELSEAKAQVTGKDGERPDLVVLGNNREERVLIEAKFWAGLTEKQPDAYLERLPDDDNSSALLFVAPERRLETLWAELLRRSNSNLRPRDNPSASAMKIAVASGTKRHLMLVSWRALLSAIQSSSESAGDGLESDVRQLAALCDQQDERAFLPIKPSELAPDFPRRMIHLNGLVDDAADRSKHQAIANTDGLKATPQNHGYGRYLRLGSKETNRWAGAWFGINFELWASYADTPLWLTFSSTGWERVISLSELRHRLPEDLWAKTDRHIPVYLQTGVEYESVLDGVVRRLEVVAKQITGAA